VTSAQQTSMSGASAPDFSDQYRETKLTRRLRALHALAELVRFLSRNEILSGAVPRYEYGTFRQQFRKFAVLGDVHDSINSQCADARRCFAAASACATNSTNCAPRNRFADPTREMVHEI